jgi:hypothetical protein
MTNERDESDPDWRAVFDDEVARWKAKSYADLRAALSGVIVKQTCCVHYDREGPGGPYQVEVQPLEDRPDYLHALVTVCAPHRWLCRSLSESFIRHADGRLD